MAAFRTLDLTLISAKDLSNVNHFHKLEIYCEVVLSTDPRSKQRTLTDREGTKNPTWNSTLKFTVPANSDATSMLNVMLRADRSLGDREVGEVHITLKEILETATGDGPTEPKFASYQVWKPCGKAKGVLNISYKLSERFNTAANSTLSANASCSGASYQPPPTTAGNPYPPPPSGYPTPAPGPTQSVVTAYPVASGAPAAYAAPPPYTYAPPPQYGYGPPPPQPGYGYPGYGYQPAAQAQPIKQKKKKNNGIGGFGAGLIGGAIGGLILGDIVSDAAEDVYDAGYDAGFDDTGGFDF